MGSKDLRLGLLKMHEGFDEILVLCNEGKLKTYLDGRLSLQASSKQIRGFGKCQHKAKW